MTSQRKILVGVVVGTCALFGLLFLCLFMNSEEGLPDDILGILPGEPSIYLHFRDLSSLESEFKSTSLYKTVFANEELARSMMDKEEFEEKKKEERDIVKRLQKALEAEFYRRYFGEETILTVVKIDTIAKPGVFSIAKTKPGLVGTTAEFAALGTMTDEETYEQKTIYVHAGEDEDDSFTFVKYGKTIVFSLFTSDTTYLKRFIDSAKAGGKYKPSKKISAIFNKESAKDHLVCYFNFAALANHFISFASGDPEDQRDAEEAADSLNKYFGRFEYAVIRSSLEGALNVETSLYFSEDAGIENKDVLYPTKGIKHDLLKYVPANALMFISFSSPTLTEEIKIKHNDLEPLSASVVTTWLGRYLDLESVDDEAVISLDGMKQAGSLPIPFIKAVVSAKDKSSAADAAQSLIESLDKISKDSPIERKKENGFTIWYREAFITQICSFAGKGVWGVSLGLDSLEKAIESSSRKVETVANTDLFKRLSAINPIENAHTIIFVNLELLGQKLEKVIPILTGLGVIESADAKSCSLLIPNLASNAKALLFTRKCYGDRITFTLTLTVE